MPATTFLSWAQRHSMFAAWAWVAYVRHSTSGNTQRGGFRDNMLLWSNGGGLLLERGMEHSRLALLELQRAADQRGDRLMVALAPPGFAVDTESMAALAEYYAVPLPLAQGPRHVMNGVLTQLGIPKCDLWDPMADAARDGDHAYLRFDGHWNRRGQEIAASAMERCIRDLGLHQAKQPLMTPASLAEGD